MSVGQSHPNVSWRFQKHFMTICLKYYGEFLPNLFKFFACIISISHVSRCSKVLHSETINLDEYYLKNDLLNYMVTVVYEENNVKFVDPLLLFQLELNTHSTSVSAYLPTYLQDDIPQTIVCLQWSMHRTLYFG